MKILFLSRWFPYPMDNGAKLRIFHLLKGLAQVQDVHLLAFSDCPETAEIAPLAAFCKEVQVVQWREFAPRSWRAVGGFFSLSPRSLIDTYSKEMEQAVRAVIAAQKFDLVIVSEWQMAAYRHLFGEIPVLFEEIEVGVFHQNVTAPAPPAARLRSALSWFKHRRYLNQMLSDNSACTVVSESERMLLASILADDRNIAVVYNGVEMPAKTPVQDSPIPFSMIFTGSFRYRPNYQAMEWFVQEVFPRICAQAPEATLRITGDPDGLVLPYFPGVQHIGFVDDVRPLIARSAVSVAPLLHGGGTRLKILEAMALGTPVVSTPKGAEGLDGQDGVHLSIASDPKKFASSVLELFSNPELRARLSDNAYQLVQQRYDWKVIMPGFLEIVERAAANEFVTKR
jgi:polysaccharide biosynthesis protein PslH